MARSPSAAMEPWGSSEGALPKKMAMFGSRWNNSETIIYIYNYIYTWICVMKCGVWSDSGGNIRKIWCLKRSVISFDHNFMAVSPRFFSKHGRFHHAIWGGLDHFQTDPNIRLFGISDTQIVRIPGKVLLYPSMFHVMHIINMYKYVCKCHL